MNQALFLNIVATRKICSAIFCFKKLCCERRYATEIKAVFGRSSNQIDALRAPIDGYKYCLISFAKWLPSLKKLEELDCGCCRICTFCTPMVRNISASILFVYFNGLTCCVSVLMDFDLYVFCLYAEETPQLRDSELWDFVNILVANQL